MQIGFCGLGRMGAAMARHVLEAGHELAVWNRSPGKAGDLLAAGATEAASPAEAARGADAVVLMLTGPAAVREVLFDPEGVDSGAEEGTLIIDASTIGPSEARSIAAELAERGLRYVDAPVFGTVGPAWEGTLTVVAGGSERDYAEAEPLLHCWGEPSRVRRLGEVGSASALKLVVNTALGVSASGLGEALKLAQALDVPRAAALAALGAGPYGSILQYKQHMISEADYSDTAFSLDLMVKDLDLALTESRRDLPVIAAALGDTRGAAQAGHGGDDFAAVIGWLTHG
jgi:3-hydroxyisobutyrate dehydrogenase